jgi:hypothetical protein
LNAIENTIQAMLATHMPWDFSESIAEVVIKKLNVNINIILFVSRLEK